MSKIVRIAAKRYIRNIRVLESRNTFKFREDRKYQWLQRICVGILERLRCHASDVSETVETYDIDPSNFMNALMAQRETVENFFGHKPSRLIIGRKNYEDLVQIRAPDCVFAFESNYTVGRDGQREDTVHGLAITVVPWIEGIVIMP